MWPFQKKSAWDKMTDSLSQTLPSSVVKTGRRAAGTIAGAAAVTVASAAISAARHRKEDQ